jgi:hypothetical protein
MTVKKIRNKLKMVFMPWKENNLTLKVSTIIKGMVDKSIFLKTKK